MEEKGLQSLRTKESTAVWAERVAERRSSGVTVARYCAEHNLNEHTFYRWQKRIFEMAQSEPEGPKFAEVRLPNTCGAPAAALQINGTKAEIYNGIDEYTLQILVRVMKSC